MLEILIDLVWKKNNRSFFENRKVIYFLDQLKHNYVFSKIKIVFLFSGAKNTYFK